MAVNVVILPDGPVASTVMLDGNVSAGGVISRTVTVNVPVAELPRVSEAEQVTVVVPSANVEPEAGEQVTGRERSTRSVAVGVKPAAAPEELVASTVMLDGNVSAGGVISLTVTVNDAVPVLSDESVAEQVTVVVPSAKVKPEAGEHVAGIAPSTLSVAVAANVTALPDGPVASTVWFGGGVTTGGVVSALAEFSTVTLICALA